MTTAWLLARVGQAAGCQFAGLSRWWRREEALGVPTLQAPNTAAEAGVALRFPPLPSAGSAYATLYGRSCLGFQGSPLASVTHPPGPGTGRGGEMPVGVRPRQPALLAGRFT